MTAPNHQLRQFKDVLMRVVTLACAVLVVAPLILVFYHLVKEGFTSLNWAFFTQLPKPVGEVGGGMANAIVGTFILIGEAALVGVPIGVLGGVYLSEYGGSKLNWWIRFAADILNGVPSIVWGIVVYGLIVMKLAAPFHGIVKSVDLEKKTVTAQSADGATQEFFVDADTRLKFDAHQLASLPAGANVIIWFHRNSDGNQLAGKIAPASWWRMCVLKVIQSKNSASGFSALAGGVVLGFMMIPLVMRTTEEVLQLVPGGYREAAMALGIAKWKTIVQIVVRTALKGIVTGVLLALSRVAGETAPLMFTAFTNLGWAHKLTEPIEAMPMQIYEYAKSPYDDWKRQAWAGAFVLLLLVLAINIGVRFLTRDRFRSKV